MISDADAAADHRELHALGVANLRRAWVKARVRALIVGGLTLAMLILIAVVFVSVGEYRVALRDILPAAMGQGEGGDVLIVQTLRVPRLIAAVLAGAAFGLSGAMFQTFTRNPLASPDIIGISAGASSAAVFAIVILEAGSLVVSGAALIGALGAATAIFTLAQKRGMTAARFILVGIAIGAMMTAITSYLLTRAEVFEAQRATTWLIGSLNGKGWEESRHLATALVILVPVALALARYLGALQHGDQVATALGVPTSRAKASVIIVGAALAAVATAAVGPVAFIALIAPSIARLLTRATYAMIPAALIGALMMVASDLVARRAFAPSEFPVGVVSGILGGPYLLWLITRANRVGRGS